jgi:hypothetical protein
MEITPPSSIAAGGIAIHSSPDSDRTGAINTNGAEVGITSNPQNSAVGAAAAAQQPKVVQTAFIHKLYKYVGESRSRSRILPRFTNVYLTFAQHA